MSRAEMTHRGAGLSAGARIALLGLLCCSGACSVFADQPPCLDDSNCLADQVCDLSSSTCVAREADDAGQTDAARIDSAGVDSSTADSSASDLTSADAGSLDATALDTSSPDSALLDAAAPDMAGLEWRCDGLDDDGDGLVDEGCDDDQDGHCDLEMTVIGSPAVCPDSPPGTADDCDDTIPDCVADCTTNTDGDNPPVVDCVERFCGSDPAVLASACHVAATRNEINDAIEQANQADGEPDFILLDDAEIDNNITTITSDDGVTIRQRAGAALRVDEDRDADVLLVEGDNVTIEGVHLVNLAHVREWIEFGGVSGTLRHSVIEGFGHRGVKISDASNTLIEGNVFISGGTDDNDNRAAINVDTASATTIVGNVLVQNNSGLSFKQADGVRIDHNTIADNTFWGLHFYDTGSTGVCARNNVVTGNGVAVGVDVTGSWDEGAGCVAPLDDTGGGPRFGNEQHGNGALCDGLCNGADEASCQLCLPSSADTFWELAVAPQYATTTNGHAGFYCPGAAELIDGADALESSDPVYDLNGPQAGMYNGAAPDIGGRETGSPFCE